MLTLAERQQQHGRSVSMTFLPQALLTVHSPVSSQDFMQDDGAERRGAGASLSNARCLQIVL
jgi:hypothetical protein